MRLASLAAIAIVVGCFAEDSPAGNTDGETGGTADDGSGTSSSAGTTQPTATSSVDSASSGDVSCEGGTCVDLPGEGWMGPFTLAFVPGGEVPPPCVAPYDQLFGVPLHFGVVPGDIDCGCTCNEPVTACEAELTKYEQDSLCQIASSFGPGQVPGQCTTTGGVDSVEYLGMRTEPPTCIGSPGEPSKELSGWEQDAVLCGLAEPPAACDSGKCVPAAAEPFAAVCIAQAGDVRCPGDFADEHLVFVDVEDQRVCDSCTCDAVSADCTPIVFSATDINCNDLDEGQSGCADTSGPTIVATTWQPTSPAACEPVQSVVGEVVGTAPHTLCCRT